MEIEKMVARLAREIAVDLDGHFAVFIGVLKGRCTSSPTLTRRLKRSVVVDFIQVSSYGASTTESSGSVTLIKDITVDVSGTDVYVVEDIVDTGTHARRHRGADAGPPPAVGAGRRRSFPSRRAAASRCRSTSSASRSRIASWLASVLTLASATVTFRTFVSWNRREPFPGDQTRPAHQTQTADSFESAG